MGLVLTDDIALELSRDRVQANADKRKTANPAWGRTLGEFCQLGRRRVPNKEALWFQPQRNEPGQRLTPAPGRGTCRPLPVT